MSYTPGPWEAKGLIVAAEGRGVVATTPTPLHFGVFECSVNARLIAAAPELLEACRDVIPWVVLATARNPQTTHPQALKNAEDCLAKLLAALAKAEGK